MRNCIDLTVLFGIIVWRELPAPAKIQRRWLLCVVRWGCWVTHLSGKVRLRIMMRLEG